MKKLANTPNSKVKSWCKYHTKAPVDYLSFMAWAKLMYKTHRQVRCPDCGLFTIWIKK